MKKLFALAAMLCCSLIAMCCAPRGAPPPRVAPHTTAAAVTIAHDFELVIHADSDFNDLGRAVIKDAADKWRGASLGRIRIDIAFDLDLGSASGLQTHMAARHALMLGVLEESNIAQEIDAQHPSKHPLAATGSLGNGSRIVILIMDRIPSANFDEVVTHELGHVVGFPDLDALGAIMSGADVTGWPVPHNLTPADIELCRSFGYCD